MAVVTAHVYAQFLKALVSGSYSLNWATAPIEVMLLTSSYVPDQDNHQFLSDVELYEVSGTGYTAGGQALANKTVSYDAVSNVVVLDADDVSWPASTITARYAVIYDNTGVSSSEKRLLGYVDFGEDTGTSNSDFRIIWDSSGIFRISVQ